MRFRRTTAPAPREEELAALADGSLAPDRREAVEAMVEESPDLAALLEEQQLALTSVQAHAAAVEAPAGLRARIEAERARRQAPARRSRFVWWGGLAGATALAVALALVISLPGNPGGPTVAEAATLVTLPATEPAPPREPGSVTLLARSVEGVPYPNWAVKFGWRATGARVDRIDGRDATTVFYEKKGRRIGYTIVTGKPLPEPEYAPRVRREGTWIKLFRSEGHPAVTWLRGGHTCILGGPGVRHATLTKLAAWDGRGTVPF